MRVVIGIAVLIGLGTVVATLLIGNSRYEPTVVREPYEAGLRWDRERRERENAGWKIAVSPKRMEAGRRTIDISVAGPAGHPLDATTVGVRFLRPFTGIEDRAYHAERRAPGVFRISVDLPARGRWDMQITVAEGDRRFTFEDSVTAE